MIDDRPSSDSLADQLTHPGADVDAMTQLAALRELQNRTAAERDRLAADLVRVEQVLAVTDRHSEEVFDTIRLADARTETAEHSYRLALNDLASARSEVIAARSAADAAQARIDVLEGELASTHRTLSWRVTAPLRSVRRLKPRR